MRFFFLIIFEHDFENILLLYFLKFNPQFNYFFFFFALIYVKITAMMNW